MIDNRDKVIDFMDMSNANNEVGKRISTWDFSMLYTYIPHDKFIAKISSFVRKLYDANIDKSYISYSNKGRSAYWSRSRSNNNVSFTCDELIDSINFIVNNSYVIFYNTIFRQIVGIPMGTNCAPFLANLFLHVYEYEYLEKLVNCGDTELAKNISKTFRFQDDCISFNDNGVFGEHFHLIYPPEMILKCTNISKAVCTFLDLRISIYWGRFRYKSFDKRNDFGFDVVQCPDLSGNIPLGSSYGVYTSQLVRFCDINQNSFGFISDVKDMSKKFLRQGFLLKKLRELYLKFCSKYLYRWAKFGIDISSNLYISKVFPLIK